MVRAEEQVLVCMDRFPVDFNVEPSILLKVYRTVLEVGHNRRHWGDHGTAMLLSVETFVVLEVVVDRQGSNK